ncbi:MAG: hypothetical protein JWM10_2573 [Myxococcaceae bacterium]|nr:hypothetical protein [Myxococcaceae bacterium]
MEPPATNTPYAPPTMPQEAPPAPRYAPPQCGARCRDGHACKAPALLWKRRCRMHGGGSTGARTPEGRAKVLACLAAGRARQLARRTGATDRHEAPRADELAAG